MNDKELHQKSLETITDLKNEVRTLKANSINTILEYVKTVRDDVDNIFKYVADRRDCSMPLLAPELTADYNLTMHSQAWAIVAYMEKLLMEAKALKLETDEQIAQVITLRKALTTILAHSNGRSGNFTKVVNVAEKALEVEEVGA